MFKKKALALVLGLAMLTSCSKVPDKNEEEQTSQTTEEIVIADPVPEISESHIWESDVPTATTVPEITNFENVRINDFINLTAYDACWGIVYPTLTLGTEDSDRINSEIADLANRLRSEGSASLGFYLIQNTDSIFTILMVESCENDFIRYYPYVIDSSTGAAVTNEQMLEMVEVDPEDVYELASDSLHSAFNNYYMNESAGITNGNPMFVEGVINDSGWAEGMTAEYYTSQEEFAATFSEDRLNAGMAMFLDENCNLVLCSRTFTDGGGTCTYHLYNLDGVFLKMFESSNRLNFNSMYFFAADTLRMLRRDDGADTYTTYYYDGNEFVVLEA